MLVVAFTSVILPVTLISASFAVTAFVKSVKLPTSVAEYPANGAVNNNTTSDIKSLIFFFILFPKFDTYISRILTFLGFLICVFYIFLQKKGPIKSVLFVVFSTICLDLRSNVNRSSSRHRFFRRLLRGIVQNL